MVLGLTRLVGDAAASPADRLVRKPLGKQIAQLIRTDILYGRLQPGAVLAQQQLCELYGTSRMPVRDAIAQLIYEGFLTSEDTRHATVVRFKRQDIVDVYRIEGLLHGLATRWATDRATDADLDDLSNLHAAMLEGEAANELKRAADLNWQFHRTINRLAASAKLVAALRPLSVSIPRDFFMHIPMHLHAANREHAQIIDAMRRREPGTAEALMSQHVSTAYEPLLDYLQSRGVDLD
jgi:DNA-binding GntR family transcriptional regulator